MEQTYEDFCNDYRLPNVAFATGYRRGYIRVAQREVLSDWHRVPSSVKGLRGNLRWAMQRMIDAGCTHYRTFDDQCPGSTQYCFTTYVGWDFERWCDPLITERWYTPAGDFRPWDTEANAWAF